MSPSESVTDKHDRYKADNYFGYAPDYYAMENRARFDTAVLEPERVRPPCAEIPDVETFLSRCSTTSDMAEYADKFDDWDDLFTTSFLDLVYKKEIPVKEARRLVRRRAEYNSGATLHLRWQGDIVGWRKSRGQTPPFPEDYYPHMRIAKYREKLQEVQTTGTKVADWKLGVR
eukprot:TRINITY_DN2579_c2_g1_i2.p1 TRINITY_DN2579_c2_g1~~TRINITY_DN2579_c2_g1_i2.p1  ORF type:complete len:173 (+),score=51.75 TRINITY_DN2579_c2_g1_i2:307-825(+)